MVMGGKDATSRPIPALAAPELIPSPLLSRPRHRSQPLPELCPQVTGVTIEGFKNCYLSSELDHIGFHLGIGFI